MDDVHLVAIGKSTDYAKKVQDYVEAHGLENRVHIIHNLKFGDLPILYHLASLFVYPSRFEGFGIPIVEALSAGVPVIASTGSCLEEAGGEHSIYVDPDDVEGMANAMKKVLADEHLRREMIEKGKEYVVRFDPKTLADEMNAVYLKCFDDKTFTEDRFVQTSSNKPDKNFSLSSFFLNKSMGNFYCNRAGISFFVLSGLLRLPLLMCKTFFKGRTVLCTHSIVR